MNLNVSIKSVGYNVGTIGYLRAGLASGKLTLEEGTLKSNGNHGLWLTGERKQFLAAFNRYGLSIGDCSEVDRYDTADDHDRDPIWTNAAWKALMEIAAKWCQERNEARAEDAEDVSDAVMSAVHMG